MSAPTVTVVASSGFGTGATTQTLSTPHTGGELLVLVLGSNSATDVTFNGTAMTSAFTEFNSTGFTSRVSGWRMAAAPATANVVVSFSVSTTCAVYCLSITGLVSQTNPSDLIGITLAQTLSAAGSSTGNIALSAIDGTSDDTLLGLFYNQSGTISSWTAGTNSTSLGVLTYTSTRGAILTTEPSNARRVLDANFTVSTTGNVAAVGIVLSGTPPRGSYIMVRRTPTQNGKSFSIKKTSITGRRISTVGGIFYGLTGGTTLANFKASIDHVDGNPTAGVNFATVTKNGVQLFRDGSTTLWPCAQPTLNGPSYEGGAYVYRINNNSGPGANELDFDLGTNYPEIFMEWWVYMPSGTESPSYGGRQYSGTDNGTANDKVFRLYNGTGGFGPAYDLTNCTVKYGMSMRGTANSTVQRCYLERQRTANVIDGAAANTDFINIGEVTEAGRFDYAGADAYVGRWVRHRVQATVATSANNDGVMKFWLDDRLVLSRTNLATYAVNGGLGNLNSFRYGYLYGYRNSGIQDSKLYIDNITFSTGGFV